MSDWSAVLAETRDLNATFYGSWSDVMGRQQQNENNKNATNVKTGPNTTADFNQIGPAPDVLGVLAAIIVAGGRFFAD